MIKELIENMEKYGFPERGKMWFHYFGFCVDHNKWFHLHKGFPAEGVGAFTVERVIEVTDETNQEHMKHITDNCTVITEQRNFMDVYNTLIVLFNKEQEK